MDTREAIKLIVEGYDIDDVVDVLLEIKDRDNQRKREQLRAKSAPKPTQKAEPKTNWKYAAGAAGGAAATAAAYGAYRLSKATF